MSLQGPYALMGATNSVGLRARAGGAAASGIVASPRFPLRLAGSRTTKNFAVVA